MIDLVVVGAGPAGLAAAALAGDLGLRVVVVDENVQAGGQYYRQPRPGIRGDRHQETGRRLIERASRVAELRLGWSAFGIDDGPRLWIERGATADRLPSRALLLATGAFDRSAAFPGWTLPGVMTAGSAQAILKGQGVLPGTRAVVAGSGPFLLVVATNLLRAGVDVAEVVEAAPLPRPGAWLARSVLQPARLRELAGYMTQLARRRVPIRRGQIVAAAEGTDHVESVTIRQRRETGGSAAGRRVEADLVCVTYGFAASTELARLAHCEMTWDEGLRQPTPRVDDWQESSTQGVFVAGEACGLGGAPMAETEGALAAVGVARRLGSLDEAGAERLAGPLRRRLRRQRQFASLLPILSPDQAAMHRLASDDTIVCRCDNATLGAIVEGATAGGATTLNEVKTLSRVGLGLCQGRLCGTILPGILAAHGVELDRSSLFTARNPVRPVPVAALAALAVPAFGGDGGSVARQPEPDETLRAPGSQQAGG